MPVELNSDSLSLIIDLPHEGYSGSRFDYTGKIRKVIYEDLHIGTSETEIYDTKKGCGFFNEFGIDSPLGYDEVDVGEEFVKPGVGYLKKVSYDLYDFFYEYSFRPFNYDYWIDKEKIIYHYKCDFNGYGFEVLKEIVLTGNRFNIKYKFENTGEKVIQTNEYVHNFISINSNNLSKNYRLIFPFQIIKDDIKKVNDKENKLIFHENLISWNDEPKTEFFLDTIKSNCSAIWTISNRMLGCEISEKGDFTAYKINLWGKRHVVSPELFKKIELNPSQKEEWSRTFSFNRIHENV
ncbi:hypothetical protein [Melioribacter sp. OK-6-Me]|uniref:hypothetical protein n=1 Tax=unclassified Melioribacter TaxID=2627329 RepID=UPI003ED87BAA